MNKKDYKEYNGIYFKKNTNDKIVEVLANCYDTGQRILLDYGDIKTGKSWGEVNDIRGTVGRSTGEIKIPLLIPTIRSHGGASILDDRIIKITDTATGEILYQAENYQANAEIVQYNDKIQALSNIARLEKSLYKIITDSKGLDILNRNITSIKKLVNKK